MNIEPATEDEARAAVKVLLRYIGENPAREGLLATPDRVVRAWDEMTRGYGEDAEAILSADFERDGYDEMVVCRDVEFFSTCEHHLLPFSGHAHVAYVPGKRIVGLSKMARLVDCFARRLQVQERLTRQVAESMRSVLKPLGVGVVVQARHLCMACRGVEKRESSMVTCCLLGCFRKHAVREEFFLHCR